MKFQAVTLALCFFGLCGCRITTVNLPTFNTVPEFQLTAQTGQPFDSKTLKGNVWIADFIYTTCPGPCPRMTSQMRDVQKQLGGIDNLRFVSFTVDPENDTPPVLAAYAKTHSADTSTWYFLTGPRATIQKLDRKVFLLGDLNAAMQHSTRFVLVDQQGRVRGYYETSDEPNIPQLIRDARALSQGRA